MEWNKAYETGNSVVDREHKEIFSLVKDVLDAVFASRKEKVDTAINFLTSYTLKHFANEEKMMQESAYPGIDDHKAQHKAFEQIVIGLKEKIKASGETMQMSNEINSVVVDWLIEHVLGIDMLFANHYKNWKE